MAEDRRRQIEGELAGWREARRRGEEAELGSTERAQAEAEGERHRLEYERLAQEARAEQEGWGRSQPASARSDRQPG